MESPCRTPYVATLDRSSGTRLKFSGKKGFGRHMPDVYSPQFAADVRAGLEKLAAQIKDDSWCIGDVQPGRTGADLQKLGPAH